MSATPVSSTARPTEAGEVKCEICGATVKSRRYPRHLRKHERRVVPTATQRSRARRQCRLCGCFLYDHEYEAHVLKQHAATTAAKPTAPTPAVVKVQVAADAGPKESPKTVVTRRPPKLVEINAPKRSEKKGKKRDSKIVWLPSKEARKVKTKRKAKRRKYSIRLLQGGLCSPR